MKGTSEETDIVKWSFKDGTVLEVKQDEHSVSHANGGPLPSQSLRVLINSAVDQPLHHLQHRHSAARALLHLSYGHGSLLQRH